MNSGYPDYYEEATTKIPNKICLQQFKVLAPRVTPALPFNTANIIDDKIRHRTELHFHEKMKSELEITMENMGCLAQADALLNQLNEITDPVKNLDIGRLEFTDIVFSGCDSKPQALTPNASNLLAPMLYASEKKYNEGENEKNDEKKLKFDKSWNFINPETNKKIEMQNIRTEEVDRITDETELIIEVVVFEGTCPTERTLFGIHHDTQKGFYRNQKRSLLQSHTFSMLGSQKLTQLSDIIRGNCRFSHEFLPSTSLEQPNEQQIGELNLGNFFMIEENFYVDYRSKRADISIEMRRWLNTAEATQSKIGQRMKERAETDPRFIAFAPHDQDTVRLKFGVVDFREKKKESGA